MRVAADWSAQSALNCKNRMQVRVPSTVTIETAFSRAKEILLISLFFFVESCEEKNVSYQCTRHLGLRVVCFFITISVT